MKEKTYIFSTKEESFEFKNTYPNESSDISGIDIQKFNKKRLEKHKKDNWGCLGAFLTGIFCFGVTYIILSNQEKEVALMVGGFLGFVVFTTGYLYINKRLIRNIKKDLFDQLIKKIDSKFLYKPWDRTLAKAFRKSGCIKIHPFKLIRIYGNFSGKYKNMNLTWGALKVPFLMQGDFRHTGYQGPWRYLFKGFFSKTETDKKYPFTTIRPTHAKLLFGKMGRLWLKILPTRLTQKFIDIKTGNKEFDENYSTWSIDKNFAKKILENKKLIEMICDIDRFKTGVVLSWKGNNFYFGVNRGDRHGLLSLELNQEITSKRVEELSLEIQKFHRVFKNMCDEAVS
jgi:hypothetical protein